MSFFSTLYEQSTVFVMSTSFDVIVMYPLLLDLIVVRQFSGGSLFEGTVTYNKINRINRAGTKLCCHNPILLAFSSPKYRGMTRCKILSVTDALIKSCKTPMYFDPGLVVKIYPSSRHTPLHVFFAGTQNLIV
jgi:hypothetical protein